MRKKEISLIVITALAFIAIIAYIVINGVLDNGDEAEVTTPETQSGEQLDGGSLLLFEKVSSEQLRSLQVWNSKGSYSFEYNYELQKFFIKGLEATPFDTSAFYNVVVTAGLPVALKRLDSPEADYSAYGLEAGGENAKYTVITRLGDSYTVRIGDKIPMGTGYYAMLEGRDTIYILSDSVEVLFLPVTSLLLPIAAYPVSSEDYQKVDNFVITKEGKKYYHLDCVPPEGNESNYSYKLIEPSGYEPNLYAYSSILQKLADFKGTEVVAAGGEKGMSDSELKMQFGIDMASPYYAISYFVGKMPSHSVFSRPNENGDIYVYFATYDIVSKMNINDTTTAQMLSFVSWDKAKLIETRIIGFDITTISDISVSGNINNGGEKLSVEAEYALNSYRLNPSDKNETLFVSNSKTGQEYDSDRVAQFRNLYRVMIRMYAYGDTDRNDVENMDKLASVVIKLENGEVYDFVFYSYSTRRCFFTVNGKGEFYCLRDDVEKVLRDTVRFEEGKNIDYDAGD